jgi:uncharacterized protein (DUF362 family)
MKNGQPGLRNVMCQMIQKLVHYIQTIKTSRIFLTLVGFIALIWFLIRVIPKPQRASYPCQKAAFPLASAFVIWVSGTLLSKRLFKKAGETIKDHHLPKAILLTVAAVFIFFASVFIIQMHDSVVSAIDQARVWKSASDLRNVETITTESQIIDPHAIVGIVRSSKANATEIEMTEVDEMIRQAVKLAGGFDSLIHEGDTVVLKPNVISSKIQNGSVPFPDSANGIATDYRVIQVVVNMVREKNATGKIFMVEGSGYGYTRANMNAIGYNKIKGLDAIICLDDTTVAWYNYSSPYIVKRSLPAGKNLYSSTNQYYLNKIYYNAQVLISLPCLKTHFLTGVTGSIKNVGIGATPTKIYGNGTSSPGDDQPGRWNHIDHGDFLTQTVPLDKWIHDFYLCRPVDYVIMDGLQGAQYGPYPGASGNLRGLSAVQMNMRLILAGKDPLAVDATEALIIGMDPYKVGYLVYLANDSAGCINPAFIKIKGTQVHEVKKAFAEENPGKQAQYSNFATPSQTWLASCNLTGNQLSFSIKSTDDIVKIEIGYADSILNPLIVSDFSNVTFPLAIENPQKEKISIYAYDRYLNCKKFASSDVLSTHSVETPKTEIFPNPAHNELFIVLPDLVSDPNLLIYSSNGKLIMQSNIGKTGAGKTSVDISDLISGSYVVVVSGKDFMFSQNFIKL